jgi:hypothetical protein
MKLMKWMFVIIITVLVVIIVTASSGGTKNNFVQSLVCSEPMKIPPPEERILVPTRKKSSASTQSRQQLIPKVIIQTNEKDMVPEGMAAASESLRKANPDYSYLYFDGKDVREFLKKHFAPEVLKAHDKLKPGAYQADLFRYCILYVMGGVYVDAPMVALAPLSTVIDPTDTFVCPEDNGWKGLYNAFMACTPKHPILKAAIDRAVYNITNEIYGEGDHGDLSITGPIMLANVFEGMYDEKVEPDRYYGEGVKIISHTATPVNVYCPGPMVGKIAWKGRAVLSTRYPQYAVDREWYNTSKRYSDLWKERDVFHKD